MCARHHLGAAFDQLAADGCTDHAAVACYEDAHILHSPDHDSSETGMSYPCCFSSA